MTCPFRHAQFEVMCQNSKLNIQGLAPCTCSQFQVSNCVQLSNDILLEILTPAY
jgi:hypothetical protein